MHRPRARRPHPRRGRRRRHEWRSLRRSSIGSASTAAPPPERVPIAMARPFTRIANPASASGPRPTVRREAVEDHVCGRDSDRRARRSGPCSASIVLADSRAPGRSRAIRQPELARRVDRDAQVVGLEEHLGQRADALDDDHALRPDRARLRRPPLQLRRKREVLGLLTPKSGSITSALDGRAENSRPVPD